jgi:alpha-D-xyloside xylohydrolase
MPYLARVAEEATRGVPMMRPMVLEFPDDRGARGVDLQYMLGDALCVSPVFSADGACDTYLPSGRWTHLLDATVADGGWTTRTYDYASLGLYVRPGTVLPIGAAGDGPEYAWADGVTLRLYELPDGYDDVTVVPGGTGAPASFRVRREGSTIRVSSDDAAAGWAVEFPGGRRVEATGAVEVVIEHG